MATVWNRTNTVLLLLVLIGIIALLAQRAAGGPLDPPGAPASTDSVKLPGTPISSIPYTITASGSYYLTRNLTAVSGDGIAINADNVTLDLMGFVLDGPDGADAQAGITDLSVSRTNVTLRNGTVRDWFRGIDLANSGRINLDDLRVVENAAGVYIGSGGIISRLVVRDNSNDGVIIFQHINDFGTELRDSVISHNVGTGVAIGANNVWVHHNVIDSNSGNGVMPYSNASWNKITDNRIVGNGFRGVYINDLSSGSPDNNLVARNAILGNSLGAVLDTGTGNRIGAFVGGDASITGSNPWSNVVY